MIIKKRLIKLRAGQENEMEEQMVDGCGNKLMDQKEVAEFLRISEKTLEHYRWRKIGPRFIKIGNLVRYRKCDVIAFVKALLEVERIEKDQNQEK
jgi:predicted DNA-binding transcriptional regulator AlpA